MSYRPLAGAAALFCTLPALADLDPASIDAAVSQVEPQVIEWRRDLHAHPELSNRETRTAGIVAKQLRALGLEVKTGIGLTGVAGLLRGAQPGPTIALRADMDALPVTEQVDVPFKSTVTTEFRGETVGVMHACGHDAHVAMLLGVAKVLAAQRAQLRGQILFIFQPAEEGAPDGETGGARRMLAEGLFDIAKPEAVFGLHVIASLPTGVIGYRAGPMMAGSDSFTINVTGRQTHGSRPWGGVDPVVTSAAIISGLQTIVSRQIDITDIPTVISIGAIKGGIRFNIIPDSVEMVGTIRTFDPGVRTDVIERMNRTVTSIAAANGATATLDVRDNAIPPVVNDPQLTQRVLPSLERIVGKDRVRTISLQTTAEDFSFYGQQAPAFFFWVGITPPDRDAATAAFNHSPLFYVDESGMAIGMRAMLAVATDYLQGK
ncbi:MAG TPA: amidohydrolase [Povalibacter sp.]|uniref:amidohydrolase n=1 Tax=Povalibacter sp. TaxID=1962978 RepID=UPI002C3E2308|nr:amidohydrolase [Povalibacter sp.]HMN46192.1 amidohydrolase [Povalibacter sp.]